MLYLSAQKCTSIADNVCTVNHILAHVVKWCGVIHCYFIPVWPRLHLITQHNAQCTFFNYSLSIERYFSPRPIFFFMLNTAHLPNNPGLKYHELVASKNILQIHLSCCYCVFGTFRTRPGGVQMCPICLDVPITSFWVSLSLSDCDWNRRRTLFLAKC